MKPNGLDLSLDCVVREDPPNNVWWWVNGTKLDLAHHRGWLTFTSNKEFKKMFYIFQQIFNQLEFVAHSGEQLTT